MNSVPISALSDNLFFNKEDIKTHMTFLWEVVEMEEIVLTFPFELDPGEYIIDVIAIVKPKIGKIRKIFRIKV